MAAVALPPLPPGWEVLSVESMGLNIPKKREFAVDVWQLKKHISRMQKTQQTSSLIYSPVQDFLLILETVYTS